ncbi:hypothetical protein WDW37_06435 [Bdellovibrionota bacterium FG-1]
MGSSEVASNLTRFESKNTNSKIFDFIPISYQMALPIFKTRQKTWLLGLFILALKILESGSNSLCQAAPPVFPQGPEGFRIGMEMEFLPESFALLTPYFDFDRLQKEQGKEITEWLPNAFCEDYLKNSPQALADLPAPLRAKLTQGLQLDSIIVHEKPIPLSTGCLRKGAHRCHQQ